MNQMLILQDDQVNFKKTTLNTNNIPLKHQKKTFVIKHRLSTAINGYQRLSTAINGYQRLSTAINRLNV